VLRLGPDEQARVAAAAAWPAPTGALTWTVIEAPVETARGPVRLASLLIAERAEVVAMASAPDDASFLTLCEVRDTDGDLILDDADLCPTEPENYNGLEDEDGCPDRGRVVVTDTVIEVLDKVYFETDSAEVRPLSYPLLDAVAATLEGNPDLLLLEVQGHADDREADAVRLSGRRGLAVRNYLVDKGIGLRRFDVVGYGADHPQDPAGSDQARALNRRVEFLILKRAGQ
jgi:outer membrane protein OmpA-like peptidoglycan-associated protein